LVAPGMGVNGLSGSDYCLRLQAWSIIAPGQLALNPAR